MKKLEHYMFRLLFLSIACVEELVGYSEDLLLILILINNLPLCKQSVLMSGHIIKTPTQADLFIV